MGVAISFLSALFPCHVPEIHRSPELVDVRAGAGAGGKTPKRLSRTRPSPYDRPPREKRRGWFSKLLLRPSIFSFLTGDGDPRPNETLPVAAAETVGPKIEFQSHADDSFKHKFFTKLVSDDDNGLAQIEHCLKDKIFSRDESIRLIELLRSRTPDLSDDHTNHARSTLHAVEAKFFHNISRDFVEDDVVDHPRNLRTIKPFRLIPKRRSVLNDDHVQVKSTPHVFQENMAAAASYSPFDSKVISWPYKRKSEDISPTVHPQISTMAQKILEHIFRPDTPTEESQNLGQAFSRPELPSSATQKDILWPTSTKSQETESNVLPQTTEMAQTALEHIDRSLFDKGKPQELDQAFPKPELPPSATSLMDGYDNNSDMRIPADCQSGSLVDREMDTQAHEHSQKLLLLPISSKSQEFETIVHSKPSKVAHKALELIDRSLSSEGQLEGLEITSSPPKPLPNFATFLMDGRDERPDLRTYDGRSVFSKGQLEKLELNFLPKPPPNSSIFMMDGQDERPDLTTYDDRSVSSKGQLEEMELTFSLPNPPPNYATFLMNDQDERPDPTTHDDRPLSSKGQLEEMEMTFSLPNPPISATFFMNGQDERPDPMTYDDRSLSSKGQLEETRLTFSLPNPPNSATFLMNDRDERPDPRTYDDHKRWSFVGNVMDISDREDSEEVLSDISTSESEEDLDLNRPSKRARTSDSGFSGTFSIPPALNLFAEPSLFPTYTFKSKENRKLDGWPG